MPVLISLWDQISKYERDVPKWSDLGSYFLSKQPQLKAYSLKGMELPEIRLQLIYSKSSFTSYCAAPSRISCIISNKLLRYIKVSQAIENERAKSRADLAQAVFDNDFISASLKVFRKSPKECKVLAIRHSKTTGHTCNTLFFCVLVIPFFFFFQTW